jgi:flap endonuclease-1
MGIKNLNKLIKEHASAAITTVTDLSFFDLWFVGVDASMSIYQWYSVGMQRKITNAKGKMINHIQGAFFRTLNMILCGINVSYIFDGKPPEMKTSVIERRRKLRTERGFHVPKEVFVEVIQLLNLMGVQTIQAPSEAEAQIATFTKLGILNAAATEDTDAIAFGAKYTIQGLTVAAKSVVVIDHARILKELKFTQEQFVDLCILMGCDYTITIPKIGMTRALNLIRKWKNIENILLHEKITPPTGFDYIGARKLLLEPTVATSRYDGESRKLTAVDIKKLREYLIDTHGLQASRIDNSLNKLAKFYNTSLY